MNYKETLERFNLFIQSLFTTHKKYGFALVGFFLLCFIYAVSKSGGETKKVHVIETKHDFKDGKVMENNTHLYKRREVRTAKALRKLEDNQKELSREVSELAKATKDLLLELKEIKNQPQEANVEEQKDSNSSENKEAESNNTNVQDSNASKADEQANSNVEYYDSTNLKTSSVSPLGKGKAPSGMYQAQGRVRARRTYKKKVPLGPSLISFPVKVTKAVRRMGVKLPSGSFAKVKLITGVSAGSKPIPALLKVDFAFVGPGQKGKSRVDLSGCFMIAKSKGNMSTERLELQITKMSCVSKDGRMFERNINGFVADAADSSFGLKAHALKSNQGRTAAMAFASSVVQGVAGAIQQGQTSTQSNALGTSSSLVTGSQTKYMVAGGAANAAGLVTRWYLKQAEGLEPQIQVNSGAELFVVIKDTIELPNWYFKKAVPKSEHNSTFTYLTRH